MIYYAILVAICYLFEILTKKRIRGFLPIFTLVFLVIAMGGNTNNPDTTIYYNMYYNKSFFDKDVGFGYLIQMSNNLGWSINTFRLIIAIVGLVLITSAVNYWLTKPSLFYLIYFIYPYMMDVVQVRNFLAMSIFVFALRFLVIESKEEKKNALLYVLLLLVASSIQKTALVYLPLVLINRVERKKFLKGIITFAAFLSVFVGLNSSMVNLIGQYVLNNLSESLSGSAGFLTRNTHYGWMILWAEQICNVMLVYYTNKLYLKDCDKMTDTKQTAFRNGLYLEVMLWINIYCFCFCPLYVLNINFYRIMRNVMVANIICYAFLIGEKGLFCNTKKKRIYTILVFSYALLMFYVNYFYNGHGEYVNSIIVPLFTDNWIFGG